MQLHTQNGGINMIIRGSVISTVVTAGLIVVSALFSLPYGTAAQAGEITLYTSMPKKAASETITAYKKLAPGEKVVLFRSGSGNILSKLQAEYSAGKARADVVMLADELSMEALKRDGRLLAHSGAQVSGLPKGSYEAGYNYFGTKMMSMILIYNTKSAKRPSSWKDILGAANKGLVLMPDAVTSGAALANYAFLTSQPGLGQSYFKALSENGALVVRANGQVRDAVASGSHKYGIVLDYVAVEAKTKGSPVDYVYPKEGVVAIYQPIAILKDSKNVASAKKFVDFMISRNGQSLVVKLGYRPLFDEVAPPKGFPKTSTVKIVPIDAVDGYGKSNALRKQFNATFSR
jgi:iron(III) transport system substrate-binding protein